MAVICIITGAHLCRNPRVVKEASALADAGHDVTVLGLAYSDELLEQDIAICNTAVWKHEIAVDLRPDHIGRFERLALRLSRKLSAEAAKYFGWEFPQSLGYGLSRMLEIALKKQADLYIGHQEVGLWVGCKLLKAGKRVGADFEDWYSRDLLPEAQATRPIRLLQRCEKFMLNHGSFSLTTSDAMASALSATYSCPKPTVVYNAFPWADREAHYDVNRDRLDRSRVSIHWVSQTIGPGRGLEVFCQALKEVAIPVDVHLRGNCNPDMESWLRDQFPSHLQHALFLHTLVPPWELLSRIAEHDIGLALEPNQPDNKNLTISNKIIHYLLAGLAVVASDTEGQKEIANMAPEAVYLFSNDNVEQLSILLNDLVSSPTRLTSARTAALKAAENKFCWDIEKLKLTTIINEILKG